MLIISCVNQLETRLGKNNLCLFGKKPKYRKVNNWPKSTKRPVAVPKTDLGSPNLHWRLFSLGQTASRQARATLPE